MYQITNKITEGILLGMTKDASIVGGAVKAIAKAPFQVAGKAAKGIGITPTGAAVSTLFAAPVGISAASGMMPSGGLKNAVFGSKTRNKLTEPVRSPHGNIF